MNNSWAMEVFPSYLSRLTLGVEEVSAGVGDSALSWCPGLQVAYFILLCSNLLPILSELLLFISVVFYKVDCLFFFFLSCSWRISSDSSALSSPSLFPFDVFGILFLYLK